MITLHGTLILICNNCHTKYYCSSDKLFRTESELYYEQTEEDSGKVLTAAGYDFYHRIKCNCGKRLEYGAHALELPIGTLKESEQWTGTSDGKNSASCSIEQGFRMDYSPGLPIIPEGLESKIIYAAPATDEENVEWEEFHYNLFLSDQDQ